MVLALGVKDLLQRAVFHDLAGVHDGHVVAEGGYNAQIMGDQQDGGVEFLLQILHHFQHLSLNGHVQSGGGLIGDEQFGAAGDGDGDHHALLHAAGELMGIIVLTESRDTHQLQDLAHALTQFSLGQLLFVELDDLGDLVAHAVDGVQTGHGILEHHGSLGAAQLAQILFLHGENGVAVQIDLALGDLGGVGGQHTEDGQGGGGFTGAGFTHQTEGLAAADGQIDTVDGLDHFAVGHVVNVKVLDFQ